MLDKGRATLAGKNGEYKYNSATDQRLVQFLGFDPDALLKELATGKGDGEILDWVQAHSRNPRSPWEIEAWSAFVTSRSGFDVMVATENAIAFCRSMGIEVPDLSGEVKGLVDVNERGSIQHGD